MCLDFSSTTRGDLRILISSRFLSSIFFSFQRKVTSFLSNVLSCGDSLFLVQTIFAFAAYHLIVFTQQEQ